MPGLPQPARLEAGVVDDDATATEEIGQYNQRARRDGAVEDHHGDALTVGELHGAHAVARPPTARSSPRRGRGIGRAEKRLRDGRAWRGEDRRGQADPTDFSRILLQSKNLHPPMRYFTFWNLRRKSFWVGLELGRSSD